MAINKLQTLKTLLGITGTGDDSLLTIYLSTAEDDVLAYTHRTTIPERAELTVVELAAYKYSRRGTEGEVSRSEGAISVSYGSSDIPDFIKAKLNAFRLLSIVKAPQGETNES